jgi:hypothetical protein
MKVKLVAIGIPVSVILFATVIGYARDRNSWRLLRVAGALCLLNVVLAHIPQAFYLVRWMRWGESDSPGHYLDFFSAMLGLTLLPFGYVFHILNRREHRANANGH